MCTEINYNKHRQNFIYIYNPNIGLGSIKNKMRRIKQILYEGNKGRWPFFPGSIGHQHSKQYSFADDQNSFIHREGGGGGGLWC